VTALFVHGWAAAQRSLQFSPVSVCSTCATFAYGINASGLVSGAYYDASGISHGFVARAGRYETIDVPDALFVEASKSNEQGDVVGDYIAADGVGRPFVRTRDGTLILLPGFPNATYTFGVDINERRETLGYFTTDPSVASGYVTYLRQASGSTLLFSFPEPNVDSTFGVGMNYHGQIVGAYTTTVPGEEHGFLRNSNGTFIRIDYPGSVQTEVFDINDRGDMVGRYTDTDGIRHGFLLRDGVFYTVDHSSPTAYPNTYLWSINARGDAAGYSFADSPSAPPTSAFVVQLR
jgi:hypothetical protein